MEKVEKSCIANPAIQFKFFRVGFDEKPTWLDECFSEGSGVRKVEEFITWHGDYIVWRRGFFPRIYDEKEFKRFFSIRVIGEGEEE